MEMVTQEPIDPARMYELLRKSASGSVLLHYAVVKSRHLEGKETTEILYEAAGDVAAELASIAKELCGDWNLEDTLLVRRTGCVGAGEIISLVAASASASEDALSACRQGIASLKKMGTIRKREVCR